MNEMVENLPSLPESAAFEFAPSDGIESLPLPYLELDARGVVTRANRATLALYPPDQGEMVGRPAWELMAIDEKETSSEAYRSLMESGGDPPVVRRTMYVRSGEFRTFELHRNYIRDAEGKPTGMRLVGIDVTDSLRVLEEAQRMRNWLQSAMESVAEAVILTDSLGFIRSLNPALEELLGWKARDMIGKVVEKAMPVLSFIPIGTNRLCFTMGLQERTRGIATVLNREGQALRVEISTAPIVDKENGFTNGVVSVLRRLE
jgi:PAS domain S-box-containing protein